MPKWSFEEWGENGLTGLETVGWMWYNYWNYLTKIKMKMEKYSFFEKKICFFSGFEKPSSVDSSQEVSKIPQKTEPLMEETGDSLVEGGEFPNYNLRIESGKLSFDGNKDDLVKEIDRYLKYESGDWNVLNLTLMGEDGATQKVKDLQQSLGFRGSAVDGKIGKKTLKRILEKLTDSGSLEDFDFSEEDVESFNNKELLKNFKSDVVGMFREDYLSSIEPSLFQSRNSFSLDFRLPASRQVLSVFIKDGKLFVQEFLLKEDSKALESGKSLVDGDDIALRYQPIQLNKSNLFESKTIIKELLENENSKLKFPLVIY